MSDERPTCGTCLFAEDRHGQLECRRHAPAPSITTYEPIAGASNQKTWQTGSFGIFPLIYATWWCGEYAVRP